MRSVLTVTLGLLLSGAACLHADEPKKLTAEQQKEIAALNQQLNAAAGRGEFDAAVKAAQEVATLREKWQGKDHWETIDARLVVEQGRRLTRVPEKDRAEVVRALKVSREGVQLHSRARYREAEEKLREALAIRQKVLGEQHPDTATSYNNLASCLDAQGKHSEVLPLVRKALAISQKVLGEQHPDTARSYHNVAGCLNAQGKHAEALPLVRKALTIFQNVHGEQHPFTAASYTGVAGCLRDQGKHAEALSLFHKALAIRQKSLGEHHPDTAESYNNVASCLDRQGRHAEALPLHQKALAMNQKALGNQHPSTAISYNNVALCLNRQGKHAEALPLNQKALDIRLKVLGEQHPFTAASYNNVALCLNAQGKHAEALPLVRKALAIRLKVLGEQHPESAQSYDNVATCLDNQGKHAEALPLYHKALAICQKTLGEQHPDTADSYKKVAYCLDAQGKAVEAAEYWEKALLGFESGRLSTSDSGFDRALFQADSTSPRAALAATLVRLGKPTQAWEHAESDLGRSLLDELGGRAVLSKEDQEKLARVHQLNQSLLSLLTREDVTDEQRKQGDTLVGERDKLSAELAREAVARSRQRVLPLERIQKQIPADTAVVFWLDVGVMKWHLGCVLRHEGEPTWVTLPGSGKDDAWTDDDDALHNRVLTALADGNSDGTARQKALEALRRQRLAPLGKHLGGVKRLLVVPSGRMAAVPVEALTERHTVSYVPSASLYALRQEAHRALEATSLLVLADPEFKRTPVTPPPAPEHGLLITAITPGGLAARIGLAAGDVLLEYDSVTLKKPEDLKPGKDERVPIKLWRDGKTLQGRIPGGVLGVVVDKRPVAEALAAWRERDREVQAALRGKDWAPLPGTRLEAHGLRTLFPEARLLTGSDASEQKLDELAADGKLKGYRLLHLATHGEANPSRPELSALILAQDKLPSEQEQAARVLAGKRPLEGRLDVATILEKWDLDADLVVLSACQTGLGKQTTGEGMLGFSQALMQKGARSVVLSRWKVDDGATALLMGRFYQNLLGKREGLKEPMPRAEALQEAKAWLRTLPRDEAQKRLAALVDGVPRGERGSIKAALPTRQPDAPKEEPDRPYAHPFYWAAFVLLGDHR